MVGAHPSHRWSLHDTRVLIASAFASQRGPRLSEARRNASSRQKCYGIAAGKKRASTATTPVADIEAGRRQESLILSGGCERSSAAADLQ
jgi:hypothetical protein